MADAVVVDVSSMVEPAKVLMEAAGFDLLNHRNRDYPNEAVGIICADGTCYPLINQARSSSRFEVSITLVREAMEILVRRDLDPVAIYHSHPTSSSDPSARDGIMMSELSGVLFVVIGNDGIAAWTWNGKLQSVVKIPLPVKVSNVEPS
ncbi:MAG: Mov34/MPN/PAD-1 family protein [Actinomycetota bacterium]|nr:Mov34/MPN/PAD-1 family protein [Actinomycetota bacterium]